MDQIDAKVFALITLGVTTAVGTIKKLFPTWTDGKEEAIATVLPIVFIVLVKLFHGFERTGWVDAFAWALGGALAAGVAHDKIVNPLMKGKKALHEK